MDVIKKEYNLEVSQAEKDKRNQLGTLRDVYVVGLLGQQDDKRTEYYHGDATKMLKIRVEDKPNKDEIKAKNSVDALFESWQEKANKQTYKDKDKRYELIAKGEFENSSKANRVENLVKKNELIFWSSERMMDYYLYCEKGVIEGVFIKVDVAIA